MWRRMKHTFIRLSTEEKVTLIGGLLILIGAFLPWYEVNLSVNNKKLTESGFSGDLGVIGFVIFLITLLGVLYLVGEHMRFRLPTFGYIKERVILFLMGQGTFLLLLTTGVYTKRSLDFTDAHIRFGLYLALIGGILATLSAYAFLQRLRKKEVEAFFGQEDETVRVTPLEEEAEEAEDFAEEVALNEEEEVMEDEPLPMTDLPEEAVVTEDEAEPEEVVVEDEMVAEVQVQEEPAEQANYFAREAGLSEEKPAEAEEPVEDNIQEEPEAVEEGPVEEVVVEEVVVEEVKEEKPRRKKKADSPSMNFYED
ncbi:MAG: hypothetical protein V1760_01310 [Candidatus Peregrinibacteria bacterium]